MGGQPASSSSLPHLLPPALCSPLLVPVQVVESAGVSMVPSCLILLRLL